MSQPYRICFVSPTLYPLFNPMQKPSYGEGDIQLFELARHFGQDRNTDISVLTGNYGQEQVEFYFGVLVYRSDFQVEKKWYSPFLGRKDPLDVILDEINADTIVMAGASGLTQRIAKYCQRTKRSFVFRIVHQRDCDGTFIHGQDKEGKQYQKALCMADVILCQTEEQKILLKRTEKLNGLVIPNTVPLPAPSNARRQDVIWIGEAVEWKQPELLYRLALTLPRYNFTMITTPKNEEYFERLVSHNRDVPNVGIENSVPYHEWPRYFEKAKLLVNTSRFEGFPYAFSMAFAHGVPVASLRVDPDGLLEHRQMGVCAHGSEVRLAQDVEDLLTYDRQWNHFSQNALAYAEEFESIRIVEKTYRKLFLQCAGRRLKKRGWRKK